MKKIVASAPAAYVNGPTSPAEALGGPTVWFVNGEAYVTDTHPFVEYARARGGYTVTDGATEPGAYTTAVAAMRAATGVQLGSRLRDAAVDPQAGDNFTRLR